MPTSPTGPPPIRIAGESDTVRVRTVETGNGARLEVRSERTGDTALLDATVLAAIARLGVAAREEIVRIAAEGHRNDQGGFDD